MYINYQSQGVTHQKELVETVPEDHTDHESDSFCQTEWKTP